MSSNTKLDFIMKHHTIVCRVEGFDCRGKSQ